MTSYLDVEDGRVAYDDSGSGPLVLCLPGLGDVRGEYRLLTPLLVGAGYRVVTMDIRGHGETSARWPDYSIEGVARDATALLRSLDAGPATLIGTSKSAGTVVLVAAGAPELVKRLVLIGAFVRDIGSPLVGRLLADGLFAGPWGVSLWIRYLSTLFPSRKPADLGAYLAALRVNLSERGRFAATRRMLTSSSAAAEAQLGRLGMPVLVLMGTKDRDFKDPTAEARLIAARIGSSAEARLMEGAGHYPQAEMPTETAAAIREFISGDARMAYGA